MAVGESLTSPTDALRRGHRRRRAGLVALCVAGLALCAPAVASATSTNQAVDYQLDANHDGDQTGDPITAPLSPAWSATFTQTVSYPLIAGGHVYVTAGNTAGAPTVYALDEATGSVLWSASLDGASAGLAYDAGEVFVLTGDGTLTAFDASSGAADWSTALGPPDVPQFTSPPTAANGMVYTAGIDDDAPVMYAVLESTGQVVWTSPLQFGGWMSSPAVDSTGVYVTYSGDQDYDFDPFTGEQLWHYDATGIEGGGGETPVLADGYLFGRDSGAIGSANIVLSAAGGVDAGTFTSTTAPAIGGGMAYMVSDGVLSAVTDSGLGTTAWTFDGDSQLLTAPLLVGDLVFVGSATGEVYAVDASGTSVWSANTGSGIDPPDPNTYPELPGLAAGEGMLVVPAANTLVAYVGANVGTGTPTNTSPPSVAGLPVVGRPIAADVGTWSALPTGYHYQWERCDADGGDCSAVAGATQDAYTPGEGDLGATLEVVVTATNGTGTSAPITSAPSAAVGPPPVYAAPTNSARPGIEGSAVQGQTLTASPGEWDELPTSYSYQWLYCEQGSCADEPDATGSTYVVDPSDIGLQIEVQVTASNADGGATATSPPTQAVTTLGPQSVRPPAISGDAVVGDTLTTTLGTWSGDPTSFAFEWVSCNVDTASCEVVGNPNQSSYTIAPGDAGNVLLVGIYAANALGVSAFTLSDPVGPVTASPPASGSGTSSAGPAGDTATGGAGGGGASLPERLSWIEPPQISGSAVVGSTLTASAGVVTIAGATFTYQWQSCNAAAACVNIPGAQQTTFEPTGALVGDALRIVVPASVDGQAVTDASAETVPVSAAIPPASASAELARAGVHITPAHGVWALVRDGLRVTARCAAACHVAITVTASGRERDVLGTIATANVHLAAGRTRRLSLRPPRHLDVALRKTPALRLDVRVVVTERGESTPYLDTIAVGR